MKISKLSYVGAALLIGLSALGGCDDSPQEQIVGAWVSVEDDEQRAIFRDDGTFLIEESGEEEAAGDYDVNDTHVTLHVTEDEQSISAQFTYYANDETLSIMAFRPLGEPDGVVGSWRSSVRIGVRDESGDIAFEPFVEFTLELRDDGTATLDTLTAFNDDPRRSRESGDYEVIDDVVIFDFLDDELSSLTLVDGEALVRADELLFERDEE